MAADCFMTAPFVLSRPDDLVIPPVPLSL